MRSNYKYTRSKVLRKAKSDARGWRWKFWPLMKEKFPVHPADDQKEQAAFESELLRTGENDIADISNDWHKKDKNLKPNYCTCLVKLDGAAMELDKDESEFKFAKEEYDKAEDEFEALPQPRFGIVAEWVLVIFLAIGEYFLNYLIFTMIGAEDIETHIIAAVISVSIPLSAVYFGRILRQDIKTLTDRLVMLGLAIFVVLVFIGIAVLRSSLFNFEWSLEDDGSSSISPFMASFIFIFINLFVWIIAMVVSYNASHRDPVTFRTLKMRMKWSRNRLRSESKELEEAERAYEKARIAYEKAKHNRKEEFDIHVADAKEIIKLTKWFIAIYRDSNISNRTSGITPPCFKSQIPELSLAVDLHESSLDWNCKNKLTTGSGSQNLN